jgi:enoyl-CoA hydratase
VTTAGDGPVRVLQAGPGITELVLNRPERFNALQSHLVSDLHEAFAAIADDRSCRVVVLKGADHREAVQAFLQRRPPRFTGR